MHVILLVSVRRDGEVWLRLLANFEMHGFRAAFQMVLSRYYPAILLKRPRLGRQGKALRRQQHQRLLENNLNHENSGNSCVSLSQKAYKDEGSWLPIACPKNQAVEGKVIQCDNDASYCESPNESSIYGAASSVDEYSLFVKFCQSGLGHLGLHHSQDIDFRGVWEETKPFAGLIGPYWSIRAALGPILETLLLLDRLLFLQEQGKDVEAVMLPIFNPILSPRNVALIAKKT